MRQTPEAVHRNLAERLCGQAADRDAWRVARRLYHQPVVDGVSQLDEGAVLDDFFDVLQELGVGDWRGDIQGTAIAHELVPIVPDVLLYGLKTRLGSERRPALPAVLFSDEARMRLVGCRPAPGALYHGAPRPGCVGRSHREGAPARPGSHV